MLIDGTTLTLMPNSRICREGVEYALAVTPAGDRLVVLSAEPPADFQGEPSEFQGIRLLLCPLTSANATALRNHLTHLQPRPLGLVTSLGMGDRLGLATPGHVRAMRTAGEGIAPIFIQQSIREMVRTGRTPRQVHDTGTWGMFAEGWQSPHGADADHLKTPQELLACLECGYTFFTIDPGEKVDGRGDTASLEELRQWVNTLPEDLAPKASGLLDARIKIEHLSIHFDEATLLGAILKYGRAVLHAAQMYDLLSRSTGGDSFEMEISVDETDLPTSHAQHVYIASQLQRLGVSWVSLAPRFVGRFEKGVDYIGSLVDFESDFAGHAAIARHFGGYKLSLHSGSDKFSIYPSASRLAEGRVHLKTAGTSYLEALRTMAEFEPILLKEIYTFAREWYQNDRRSYHVSAELERAPLPETVRDWTQLLDQFDAREILHVTFGSVLTEKTISGERRFFERLMTFLQTHPEAYADNLERHFVRHIQLFSGSDHAKI